MGGSPLLRLSFLPVVRYLVSMTDIELTLMNSVGGDKQRVPGSTSELFIVVTGYGFEVTDVSSGDHRRVSPFASTFGLEITPLH